MELGTSCLSLGLVCFAVALVGGHREHFFAAWEGGSWVASLEISLRDGNLGIIIFTNLKREAQLWEQMYFSIFCEESRWEWPLMWWTPVTPPCAPL